MAGRRSASLPVSPQAVTRMRNGSCIFRPAWLAVGYVGAWGAEARTMGRKCAFSTRAAPKRAQVPREKGP